MKLLGIPGSRFPELRRAVPASLIGLLVGAGACAAPSEEPVEPVEPVSAVAQADTQVAAPLLDITRSLAVTDLPTLEATDAQGQPRFSFRRVLDRIAATAGLGPSFGAPQLYQRIFDTNNTKAGGFVADGQHCDDQLDADGKPVLNGSRIQCPRQEGALANLALHNPFCSGPGCDPYTPIAITNRFDLAPSNGQTCGQYRIVFGKGNQQSPLALAGNPDAFNRTLIILEAIMPNPKQSLGLAGCAPLVDFWAGLSAISDPAQRAAQLDRLFFTGITGFEPVLRFSHYTGAVDAHTQVQLSGQFRANQFMFDVLPPPLGGQAWQLREYNLDHACTGTGAHTTCGARVKLVTPKVNPDASLFDDANTSPRALAFRDPANPSGFLSQVAQLATPDLNLLNMNGLSPTFNGGQSTSSPVFPGVDPLNDSNYKTTFNATGAFAGKIQAVLTGMGSKLFPVHIVRRAQTQACAGCHELATSTASFFGGGNEGNKVGGGLTWPDAALDSQAASGSQPGFTLPAFTQTSEQLLAPLAAGVTCDAACTAHAATCQCAWQLSPALTGVFLPFRRDNMSSFLSKVHSGTFSSASPSSASARMCGSPDN
jgi:hypothetical protein